MCFALKLFIFNCQLSIANSSIFTRVSTNPNTRNFFNSIGDPDDVSGHGTEILKIAVNQKFIRYFIEKKANPTIVFYGDYALQSVSGDEGIAEQLSNILAKDAFLSRAFDSVKICWFTDFEIIPSVFFDESELAADTAYNPIMDGEANFIFEVPKAINEVLKSKFTNIEHYHSGAAMIERLRKEGVARPDKFFINIHAENIEIA